AAGVTHRRGGALVKFRPLDARFFCGKQLVVTQHFPKPRGITLSNNDEVFDRFEVAGHSRQQRNDRLIYDDHLVLSVIDYVRKLFRKESEIQSVKNRTHARDCEISFEMFLSVPRERAYAITLLNAEPY